MLDAHVEDFAVMPRGAFEDDDLITRRPTHDRLEELHEWAFPIDRGELVPAEVVDDLPEERDFLHAARDEAAHFLHDLRNAAPQVLGTMQKVQCMLRLA